MNFILSLSNKTATMSNINTILKWLKNEFDQMSFFILILYLLLAFWVVFIDTEITDGFLDLLIKLFFEMTGILAIVELLKRLFPNFNWEKKEEF